VKLLTKRVVGGRLQFSQHLSILFPRVIDLKVLATKSNRFFGGLESLAKAMNVSRVGASHNSGSDARLTGDVFFKALQMQEWQRAYTSSNGKIFGM
jgi:hypothetical protein